MLLIIVHRLLQSFFLPPFNAIIIIIIGIILTNFRKKTGIIIALLGILLLYIQATPIMAYWISKKYELPPLTSQEFQSSQAIVILGGGVNRKGPEYTLDANVSKATLIRLNYAVFLAKQDPTKLIIPSGGYTGNIREADLMRELLIDIYKVTNPIIVENQSRNTDENAKFAANILLARNIKNVIIVTQAFHMRRAMMLFHKYGLNPVAGSTDYYTDDNALTPALMFIPNAGAMHQVATIYHEILGYLVYE
ncbi:MAG: YdcF family protein [Burkholderiales bacterium]|nr:YdcF family protein [Burkholderiales bacterium]